MKIKIEIDPTIEEPEVTIKCPALDDTVTNLQRVLSEAALQKNRITFRQGDSEYYFPVEKVLFFETTDNGIVAHTENDEFTVDYKLYELEELLPSYFMRIAKSTILNSRKVYSITRNLTASSKVEFEGSHKIVYVSRNYYKALINQLNSNRFNNQ